MSSSAITSRMERVGSTRQIWIATGMAATTATYIQVCGGCLSRGCLCGGPCTRCLPLGSHAALLMCAVCAVIRYDLEFLGLCPCSVDVEIIDSKAGNASTLVRCGIEGCTCSNKVRCTSHEQQLQAGRLRAPACKIS